MILPRVSSAIHGREGLWVTLELANPLFGHWPLEGAPSSPQTHHALSEPRRWFSVHAAHSSPQLRKREAQRLPFSETLLSRAQLPSVSTTPHEAVPTVQMTRQVSSRAGCLARDAQLGFGNLRCKPRFICLYPRCCACTVKSDAHSLPLPLNCYCVVPYSGLLL